MATLVSRMLILTSDSTLLISWVDLALGADGTLKGNFEWVWMEFFWATGCSAGIVWLLL